MAWIPGFSSQERMGHPFALPRRLGRGFFQDFDLTINAQNLRHLLFELGAAVFKIVTHLVRLDLLFAGYLAHRALDQSGQTRVPCRRAVFARMACQQPRRPKLMRIRAMTQVMTLMPVLPKNRSIRAAIHNVSPIKKVARTDAAASNALASHPGLSLESVIMMLISAGPTSSGNANGVTASPWIHVPCAGEEEFIERFRSLGPQRIYGGGKGPLFVENDSTPGTATN
jgi:hypothetical protein